MTPGPGVEPRPHWWEASALTTAPPLLPLNLFYTAGISLEQGENQQQAQPTYDARGPGIEPRPHWWEASALTTAPPLVPNTHQGENQQQTQPTYDAGSRNRTQATLVGGERSYHCATPGPLESILYSGHIPRARREPTTNSTHI